MKTPKKLFDVSALVLLVCSPYLLNAQNLSGKKIHNYPASYQQPQPAMKIDTVYDPMKPAQTWYVYSDRDNNKTYSTPNANADTKNTINFMDCFFVIDETPKFLHIVKYAPDVYTEKKSKQNAQTWLLNEKASDYGWVLKSTMMLWKHSLVNNKNFTIKALAVVKDKDVLDNLERYTKKGSNIKMFNDPGLSDENKNDVRLFQYMYVYKIDPLNKSYLIGNSEFILADHTESILGWVSENLVELWDQRLCIEPNSSSDGVTERKGADIKASLFLTEDEAKEYRGKGVGNAVWNKDTYYQRYDPNWKRLPVFNYDTGTSMIKTGFVTEIVDNGGKPVITTEENIQILRSYNESRKNIRDVNVVFVMDGSSSMKDYFKPVADVLSNTVSSLIYTSQNKFKFGTVIYRDYAEEQCTSGNRLFDQLSLTDEDDKLRTFLYGISDSALKDCNDKSSSQAVYYGLNLALRMLQNANPEATKVIVLVGGAGNPEPDNDPKHPTKDQIIDLCYKNKVRFLSFQVASPFDPSYLTFNKQMQEIIRKSAVKINTDLQKEVKDMPDKFSKVKDNPSFREPAELSSMNVYSLDYPDHSPLPGWILFPTNRGEVMSTKFLSATFDSLIRQIDYDIDDALAELNSKAQGQGERAVQITPELLMYWQMIGQKVNNDALMDKFLDDNFQFFIPAYTSVKVKSLKYPVFSYVLFVNLSEAQQLHSVLSRVILSSSNTKDLRIQLKDAYEELARLYMGLEGKQALKANLNDIINEVTGLPGRNELLLKYKIRDFDSDQMSQPDLQKIVDYLYKKNQDLEKYYNNPANAMISNDKSYFWIPQSVLP